MANTLISPSMVARFGIHFASRCLRLPENQSMEIAGPEQFVAQARIPFDTAETTRAVEDYIDLHMHEAVNKLLDELLFAKRVYQLPLPEKRLCARHHFDGISMRCTIDYEPETDMSVAVLEVAYDC